MSAGTARTASPGGVVDPMPGTAGLRVDYLVGGLRIGLGPGSHTPGPRSHIRQFLGALERNGGSARLFLASEQRFLGAIARLPEGAAGAESDGSGGALTWSRRRGRLLAGDALRLAAAGWSSLCVWQWSGRSDAPVIYERSAVLQRLGPAHRNRRRAIWIVESNGIFSRETATDRQALGSTRLAAAIERATYRGADLVVAVSESLRRELCQFAGLPPARVLVLPNAIPDAALVMPRRPAPGPPVLGFSGSLVPWQRLDRLLTACAPSLRAGRLRLEIIGVGPERAPTESLARALGVAAAVAFLGSLPHDEVLTRMSTWTAGYAGHVATSSAAMYHSPLKLWEYAGLGLDVLASPSDDAELLRRAGLRIVGLGPPAEQVTEQAADRGADQLADRASGSPSATNPGGGDGPSSPASGGGATRCASETDAVDALLALPSRSPAQLSELRAHLAAEHSWSARLATLEVAVAPLLAARPEPPSSAGPRSPIHPLAARHPVRRRFGNRAPTR